MATHAETMAVGQTALLNGLEGYELKHLDDCVANTGPTLSACSCGLDMSWTTSVLQAADMVTKYGTVPIVQTD